MNFPARPTDWVQVEWAPVFLEPITSSGERIVAGVVGLADRRPLTLPALDPGTARRRFGQRGRELAALIREVLDDASDCLEIKPDLNAWIPLIAGVEVGDISTTHGPTAQDALLRALESHSYLRALIEGQSTLGEPVVADSTAASQQSLSRQTLDTLLQRRPDFAQFVGNPLAVRGPQAPKWRYDFYGCRLAAQIKPFRIAAKEDAHIEKGILQLAILGKTDYARPLRSLILIRGDDDYTDAHTLRQVTGRLKGIEQDCALSDVTFIECARTTEAVERIIEMEEQTA